MRPTFAVMPVKAYDDAKSRLGPAVPPADRRLLVDAMARDVLRALVATPGLDAVVVVTDEPVLQLVAAHVGAIVVPEGGPGSHDTAAAAGLDRATAGGAQRVLCVAADCPGVDPLELAGLLSCDEAVVVVPDRHDTGTNALLLAAPAAIAPRFGGASRERHERAAERCGCSWATRRVPSLACDVDEPADVAALLARPRLGWHTRSALRELAIREAQRA